MRGFTNAVAGGLAAVALLAGVAAHGQVALELVVDGLDTPVLATHAGDGSGRLFIVTQGGTIEIWNGAQLLPGPFLDITDRVLLGGEQGLLGLAFHPDYATNGRFYVHYSAAPDGDTVLAGFEVSADDPNVANPDLERVMFTTSQPFNDHNGGSLEFSPVDGMLYLGLGDGGSIGDPDDRGQDLGVPWGKILRFDVDIPPPYIPASNPFVGVPDALDEIWAYGLRNPWRLSFDSLTGDLYIGDVGQELIEEVDFQPASSPGGENYGWSLMEGTQCFDPPTDCDDGTLVMPIIEYPHFDNGFFGCAVTGGYVYRGTALPDFVGRYFFGDFCSGRIWAAGRTQQGDWRFEEQLNATLPIFSFGVDENGELYVLGSGGVWRIVESDRQVPCSVQADADVYDVGDPFGASVLEVENLGTNPETVQLTVGVIRGGGRPPVIVFEVGADGSLTVEPGETMDFAPLDFGNVPAGAPPNDYGLGCRVTDPTSGDVLGQSQDGFEIQ